MDCLPSNGRLITTSEAVYIPIAVLCAVAMVMTSLIVAINLRFRNYKLLKMTSPNLNLVMLVGSIFLIVSVLLNGASTFLSDRPTKANIAIVWRVTQASVWFLCIGFTLFFAPLATKTWRVHKIFTDAAIKGRVIKDDRLLCIVAAVVMFDLVFLGLWYILDMPECQLIPYTSAPGFWSIDKSNIPSIEVSSATISPPKLEEIIEDYVSICASAYTPVWAVVIATYKAALLFYVIYVSWATRFVTFPSMKDSSGIIISSFVTLILFCSGMPLIVSLTRWPSVQFGIYATVVLISTGTFLALHYIPKVLLLRKHRKDEGIARGFSQYTTPQKREFTDEEVRDLVVQNNSLRKEIQEKQRKYKLLLEQHRLAKAQLLKLTFRKGDIPNEKAPGLELPNDEISSSSVTTCNENSDTKLTKSMSASPSSESSPCDNNIKQTNNNNNNVKLKQIDETNKNKTNKVPEETEKKSILLRPQNDGKSRELSPLRRVSFHPEICQYDEESNDHVDGRITVRSEIHETPVSLQQKANPIKKHHPQFGKKGWEYYTRGTGYLRYKENVLLHNNSDDIISNANTKDPNRIVARKSEAFTITRPPNNTNIKHNGAVMRHSIPQHINVHYSTTPVSTSTSKTDFRYYSTSAGSRSPSTGSETRQKSNDNNDGVKADDYNSTGSEMAKTKLILSVKSKTKEKRPVTGNNSMTVRTCETPDSIHRINFDFTSGSDSDDYDDSSSSMDSISCELFPPLSYRHRHYLRHYDLMHAKYIAHRDKQRKRQKKNALYYLEKSEGYSSDTDNKSESKRSRTPHKLDVSPGEGKTRKSAHLQRNPHDRFMYDSITSSDSDSDSSFIEEYWFKRQNNGKIQDPHTLHKCWHKVASKQQIEESYDAPKSIPLSTTRTQGIFV